MLISWFVFWPSNCSPHLAISRDNLLEAYMIIYPSVMTRFALRLCASWFEPRDINLLIYWPWNGSVTMVYQLFYHLSFLSYKPDDTHRRIEKGRKKDRAQAKCHLLWWSITIYGILRCTVLLFCCWNKLTLDIIIKYIYLYSALMQSFRGAWWQVSHWQLGDVKLTTFSIVRVRNKIVHNNIYIQTECFPPAEEFVCIHLEHGCHRYSIYCCCSW